MTAINVLTAMGLEAALRYVKVGLAVGNCSGLLNAPAGS
jgi:hypothetical protein